MSRDLIGPDRPVTAELVEDDIDRIAAAVVDEIEERSSAIDALRKRLAQVESALREALELYNDSEVCGPTREDIRRIAELGQLLDPPWVPSWKRPESDSLPEGRADLDARYLKFIALRDSLDDKMCLACGNHDPRCQCENDE